MGTRVSRRACHTLRTLLKNTLLCSGHVEAPRKAAGGGVPMRLAIALSVILAERSE